MIPSQIYELACALSEVFGIDFDESVSKAWEVFRELEAAGVALECRP